MKNAHDILIRPILTEKSYSIIPEKKYTFEVLYTATKQDIKAAVEEIFKVKVDSVNLISVKGKLKRMGKNEGYTSKYKKAIIKLNSKSKALELFESLS